MYHLLMLFCQLCFVVATVLPGCFFAPQPRNKMSIYHLTQIKVLLWQNDIAVAKQFCNYFYQRQISLKDMMPG